MPREAHNDVPAAGRSAADYLTPRLRFRPRTVRAVKRFARSKPWQGTAQDRRRKFKACHDALCRVYGRETRLLFQDGDGDSGASSYCQALDLITLRGRLSVVTFLHEWAHALRGPGEAAARQWSIQLFAKCFPRSWAQAQTHGATHMIRRSS